MVDPSALLWRSLPAADRDAALTSFASLGARAPIALEAARRLLVEPRALAVDAVTRFEFGDLRVERRDVQGMRLWLVTSGDAWVLAQSKRWQALSAPPTLLGVARERWLGNALASHPWELDDGLEAATDLTGFGLPPDPGCGPTCATDDGEEPPPPAPWTELPDAERAAFVSALRASGSAHAEAAATFLEAMPVRLIDYATRFELGDIRVEQRFVRGETTWVVCCGPDYYLSLERAWERCGVPPSLTGVALERWLDGFLGRMPRSFEEAMAEASALAASPPEAG